MKNICLQQRRHNSVFTAGTVAKDELLCLKNPGAQISMFFTSNEYLAPMAIKIIIILGAVLELPAKQHC